MNKIVVVIDLFQFVELMKIVAFVNMLILRD